LKTYLNVLIQNFIDTAVTASKVQGGSIHTTLRGDALIAGPGPCQPGPPRRRHQHYDVLAAGLAGRPGRFRHRVPGVLSGLWPRAGHRRFDGVTDDPFVTHRSLLFTVAYAMLGSAADAEDVVRETWLRRADVDHAEVRDPRAYLVRIVTR
jgi:hypothetical protein